MPSICWAARRMLRPESPEKPLVSNSPMTSMGPSASSSAKVNVAGSSTYSAVISRSSVLVSTEIRSVRVAS